MQSANQSVRVIAVAMNRTKNYRPQSCLMRACSRLKYAIVFLLMLVAFKVRSFVGSVGANDSLPPMAMQLNRTSCFASPTIPAGLFASGPCAFETI